MTANAANTSTGPRGIGHNAKISAAQRIVRFPYNTNQLITLKG